VLGEQQQGHAQAGEERGQVHGLEQEQGALQERIHHHENWITRQKFRRNFEKQSKGDSFNSCK
jgi:hypothetical protein